MIRSNLRLAALLSLSASALSIAAPALAQQQDAASEEEADIVVTAQRANETQVIRGGSVGVLGDKPAEDVPFSIRSYNEALILNQQPVTLGELLENDPTVRTTYGFGNAAEQFVIRGFPLFGDDVGVNGLYGIAPRQLIAPELYEQVQVLNGASAFLNGAAPGGTGIGGSVNLITKRAAPRPLTRLTAGYISEGHIGGSGDVSRRFGDWGVRLKGAYRTGEIGIEDEDRTTMVAGGALDYQTTNFRAALTLAYQRMEVEQLRPKVTLATTVIPDVPEADANYAQPWTFTELRDVFGTLTLEYDVTDNTMVYAAFGARDGREDGIYGGTTVTDATTGAATGSAIRVPRTDNNEAALLGFRARLEAAGISHEFNFGGSALRQVNRNAFDFFAGYATNLYDTPEAAMPGSIFPGGNIDDPFPIGRNRLMSAFASDTVGVWDDRLLATAGLRLQTINVKSYAYANGSLTSEYDEDAVTPVFGLVVKPVEGVSLYANRVEGLAQGPSAPLDPNLVNPGEVFAPFTSVQYETGAKVDLGRFNASLGYFRTDLPSAYARPLDPADPAGPLVFGVFGEQRNSGFELVLDGEPMEGLRIIAGGSLLDAELRNTTGGINEGNRAAGVPDYLLNANAEWDLPFLPAATLTGRVVHTGHQYANAANTLELDSWTRLDLGLRYVAVVADSPLTLRFNVDNVTNARYWASAFDAFGAALLQGAPRTFQLSASVEL